MNNPDNLLIGVINTLSKKIRRYCDRNAAEMGLTGNGLRIVFQEVAIRPGAFAPPCSRKRFGGSASGIRSAACDPTALFGV